MNKILSTSLLAISVGLFSGTSYASTTVDAAEHIYTLNRMGAPDTVEWIDSYDGVVLSSLQDLGYLPSDIVGKKVLNIMLGCEASNCSRILVLEGNDGQSYIVKEMLGKKDSEYKREKVLFDSGLLPEVQGVMSAYKATESKVLPALTRYLGLAEIMVGEEEVPVSVMTKVKGVPLKDILLRLEDSDHNQDADFISDTVAIAHNIGEQMGQLTRAFFLSDKTLLMHADPSVNNFFYDEASGQFSWIDLGGLSRVPHTKKEFGSVYDDETGMVKTIWWCFFPFQKRYEFTSLWNPDTRSHSSLVKEVEEKGLGVLAHHRIGILAGEAFYKAYLAQVEDLSYVQSALAGDAHFKEFCPDEHDFFGNSVKYFTGMYTDDLAKAFGDQSAKVLEYLFAPHQVVEAELETPEADVTAVLTEDDFVMGTYWAPIADKIARSAEHKLSEALRDGDFDKAQKIIDAGADITRVFYSGRPEHFEAAYSFIKPRLLDMTMSGEKYPEGTIAFLLKNGADVRGAVLDNAIYHYKSASDIRLLVEAGINLGDLGLALYRAIDHGDIDLVDLLISVGAPVEGFINGHPKIYAAPQGNPAMWNHMIDLGARGHDGEGLSKK